MKEILLMIEEYGAKSNVKFELVLNILDSEGYVLDVVELPEDNLEQFLQDSIDTWQDIA